MGVAGSGDVPEYYEACEWLSVDQLIEYAPGLILKSRQDIVAPWKGQSLILEKREDI